MSQIPECPLIELSGTASVRGQQYGEQAKKQILKGVEHYSEQIDSRGLKRDDLGEIIGLFQQKIEEFDPAYIEEMQGIADGAGVDLTSIVLLNSRTEVLKIARRREMGLPVFVEPDGCTGVIVLPEATRAGRLIHAQNWDWKTECVETAVVLKIKRDDGPDIVTFTEAGGLARAGFNSAGVSITGNYLESDRDYRNVGTPLAVIRRKVLEQSFVAHSLSAAYTTRKSASNNLMIAQSNGFGIDFECVPDETFAVQPVDGLLVHANHFQSPVALSKVQDRGMKTMADSLYRDFRVRGLITPHLGDITPAHVKSALLDDFETPWSVCRPPRQNLANNQSATVAMIVMEPALGRLEVALLPAHNRKFAQYKLEMDIVQPNFVSADDLEQVAA